MTVTNKSNQTKKSIAINEVSILQGAEFNLNGIELTLNF